MVEFLAQLEHFCVMLSYANVAKSWLNHQSIEIFPSVMILNIYLQYHEQNQEQQRTCHLPIVLLQLMDLAPFAPLLLVDVNLVVIGTHRHL